MKLYWKIRVEKVPLGSIGKESKEVKTFFLPETEVNKHSLKLKHHEMTNQGCYLETQK